MCGGRVRSWWHKRKFTTTVAYWVPPRLGTHVFRHKIETTLDNILRRFHCLLDISLEPMAVAPTCLQYTKSNAKAYTTMSVVRRMRRKRTCHGQKAWMSLRLRLIDISKKWVVGATMLRCCGQARAFVVSSSLWERCGPRKPSRCLPRAFALFCE